MAVGGTLLKRQKRFLRLDFLNRGGRSARGVRGNSSPMGGSPLGGAHGQGVRTASPSRPEGRMGLTGCTPGWGGGRQAASKQRASKKANGWEPPGGRKGKGCVRQAPLVPKGEWGLPDAPLGGAGENFSRQGCCAPELRGRRGLTSSICVISACANIHRISPHFVLRLIMEPRGICLSWCKHDRCHKDSKEPRGICNLFFECSPLAKGEHEKNDFFGRQGTCAPELRGLNRG